MFAAFSEKDQEEVELKEMVDPALMAQVGNIKSAVF